jgi:hypothetical protein
MANVTVSIPSWVSTPTDLASTLMDGPAFVDLGRALDDLIDEHQQATEDMARVREILVLFGALVESDTATGLVDLLEVLLPGSEGS